MPKQVVEVKQKFCDQVSDNGQSARQGFGSGLHAGLKSLLKNVPDSVGLTPQNLPTFDKMNSFTGTGIMSLLLGVNILGSATMAFTFNDISFRGCFFYKLCGWFATRSLE